MMQIEYPFPILLSHDQLFKKIQFPIHKARTTYVVLEYVYHTEIGSLQHGYIYYLGGFKSMIAYYRAALIVDLKCQITVCF